MRRSETALAQHLRSRIAVESTLLPPAPDRPKGAASRGSRIRRWAPDILGGLAAVAVLSICMGLAGMAHRPSLEGFLELAGDPEVDFEALAGTMDALRASFREGRGIGP